MYPRTESLPNLQYGPLFNFRYSLLTLLEQRNKEYSRVANIKAERSIFWTVPLLAQVGRKKLEGKGVVLKGKGNMLKNTKQIYFHKSFLQIYRCARNGDPHRLAPQVLGCTAHCARQQPPLHRLCILHVSSSVWAQDKMVGKKHCSQLLFEGSSL